MSAIQLVGESLDRLNMITRAASSGANITSRGTPASSPATGYSRVADQLDTVASDLRSASDKAFEGGAPYGTSRTTERFLHEAAAESRSLADALRTSHGKAASDLSGPPLSVTRSDLAAAARGIASKVEATRQPIRAGHPKLMVVDHRKLMVVDRNNGWRAVDPSTIDISPESARKSFHDMVEREGHRRGTLLADLLIDRRMPHHWPKRLTIGSYPWHHDRGSFSDVIARGPDGRIRFPTKKS